jgi:F0F1-type ATP synthase membrane subunit c/vacuolar-type H+-ATPase subunit K
MKRSIIPALAALAVGLGALASSGAARAEAAVKVTAARATLPGRSALPHDVITYEESMPNGALIGSGLTMFGASYIPSMIVAASSDHPGDTMLYVPVAGPWMNLAQRDSGCPGGRCDNDAANKVLLVADGVFQGLGALQILGGFLFPTTRTVTQVAGVHVLPSLSAHEVGLAAIGRF